MLLIRTRLSDGFESRTILKCPPAWLQFCRAGTARFPNRTRTDRRGTGLMANSSERDRKDGLSSAPAAASPLSWYSETTTTAGRTRSLSPRIISSSSTPGRAGQCTRGKSRQWTKNSSSAITVRIADQSRRRLIITALTTLFLRRHPSPGTGTTASGYSCRGQTECLLSPEVGVQRRRAKWYLVSLADGC